MRSVLFILSALALASSGCVNAPIAGPAEMPTSTPFDSAAYAPYRNAGTARISGHAFLKTRGGDVKVGAGNTITLSPATAFARDVRALRDRGISPSNYTPDVLAQIRDTIRQTTADAQGAFEFDRLPPGEYLLETVIEWEVPSRYGLRSTGGAVRKYVTIQDGEAQRVMLTE